MRRLACIALFCVIVVPARADSFRERLNAANALLRGGDIQAAIDGYRDLRVDEPDSPELFYNLGCAKYQEALRTVESGSTVPGENPFEEARASFEKAQALGAGSMREDASFNKANCLAQYAKHLPSDAEQKQIVEAYQQSISAYEDVLRQYPGHSGARKNLDHMRYLLKKMLQNPPPPEDQEGKGENEPQDQQQPQEQQPPQESEQPQEGNQQEEQTQQQAESDDERSESEDKSQPEQSEQDENRQNQMENASEPDSEEQEERQAQATETADLPDRQTIEALLQSLEDRDQMEQQSERREPRQTRIRREWW